METIPKGTSFIEFLYKIDALGAIQRKLEYREKLGLPQVYDVYIREPDGTFTYKTEIIKEKTTK